jgi:hypothetical protein
MNSLYQEEEKKKKKERIDVEKKDRIDTNRIM